VRVRQDKVNRSLIARITRSLLRRVRSKRLGARASFASSSGAFPPHKRAMSGDKPLLYETLRERVYAQDKKRKIVLNYSSNKRSASASKLQIKRLNLEL
jgi:hypothetical protein